MPTKDYRGLVSNIGIGKSRNSRMITLKSRSSSAASPVCWLARSCREHAPIDKTNIRQYITNTT